MRSSRRRFGIQRTRSKNALATQVDPVRTFELKFRIGIRANSNIDLP